jgi:carotenoid cleavage dioxygenase
MTATNATQDTVEPTPWHLSGNNAPVFDEATLTELEVRGTIPPELNGRYFRNGANPQTGTSVHWFLGDGMIHGVELGGGRANWYRNRYVRTPCLAQPDKGRMELMLDPETFAIDYNVSVANTHIISHAGRILALEEGAFPYEMSPTLGTIGPWNFDGKLTTAMTAHPKICPETGELLFFSYGFLEPYLTYHRADAQGRLVQSTDITVAGPTMHHDFAASRAHTVFMDLPMVFDMELAMLGTMPIRWSDDYPARFGILPRAGGDADVRWFDVEPCYVFHTLNAHDEGDTVVVRGCRMPEVWRDSPAMEPGVGEPDPATMPRLHEWRFDLATGRVAERYVDDEPCDFPRLADRDAGLPARYGYTMSMSFGSGGGRILKYDLTDDSKTAHQFPAGQSPAESVFVPAAGGTQPDDGYLLTYVYDQAADASNLAILDASNMAADPIAEVVLPRRVPTGFHGSWIPDPA